MSGTVGSAVTQPPTVIVRDAQATPMAGVTVAFTIVAGGGTVQTASATTDASGIASAGTWTLGQTVGSNTLRATVGALSPVEFTAAAGPAAPASITALDPQTQTGTVGAAPAALPRAIVKDPFGNPVPNVAVTFTAPPNAGTIAGVSRATDAAGTAQLGSWTLGTVAGVQNVSAAAAGVSTVAQFSVDARPGPPASMTLIAGADQMEVVGTTLRVAPAVRIEDRYANRIGGTTITFAVAAGGGTVTGGSVATDAEGRASVGSWRLGPAQGIHVLNASVAGLPPLGIQAKAVPVSNFDPELRFVTSVTARQREAFEAAVARWRKVIIGDLRDAYASLPANFCGRGEPALNELIDDILIYVEVRVIDGPGKVVASAGPCAHRASDGMPGLGVMRFDVDDLADLERDGQLVETILHEMAHVFGVGTMWGYHGLVANAGTPDPYYIGPSGRAGWALVGGNAYPGNPVPVENTGGGGSRDSHWRTSVLNSEVMTAFLGPPGRRAPLSLVTIGALEDLGYLITPYGDDRYQYGVDRRAGVASVQRRELRETPLELPAQVTDPTGLLTREPRQRGVRTARPGEMARRERETAQALKVSAP